MSKQTHETPRKSYACPQCGAHVFSAGEPSQLQCGFCEAITLLAPQDSEAEGIQLSRNASVDLSKYNIYVDGDYLQIWWSWNRYVGIAALLLSALALGWALLSLQWMPALLQADEFKREQLIGVLFGLIPLLAFLQFAYIGLAMLFNRSVITVEDGVLKSSHPPLPCYWWRQLPLTQLKELQTHRERKKRERGEITIGSGDQYELHALTHAGSKVVLLKYEKTAAVPQAVRAVLTSHIAGRLSPQVAGASGKTSPPVSRRTPATPAKEKVVLICPKCGGLTPPPSKMTSSRCTYCDAELEVDEAIWKSVGLHPPRRRNIDHVPVTLVVRDEGDTLRITADWNRAGAFAVLMVTASIVGLAVAACLVILWLEGWSVTGFLQGGSLFAFLALLLIGAPATCLGYLALCQWINRTQVTVYPTRIHVWNGPLPMRATKELPTGRIKQISVHPSACVNAQGKTRGSYDLDAISDYGSTFPLLFDQAELKGLRTIERLIEQRLEIADKVVSGEA